METTDQRTEARSANLETLVLHERPQEIRIRLTYNVVILGFYSLILCSSVSFIVPFEKATKLVVGTC